MSAVLRDDAGQPVANTSVTFRSVGVSAYLLANGSAIPSAIVVDTTDAAGLATVMVQWGVQPGEVWVVATAEAAIPAAGLASADSIRLETLPGRPDRLLISPLDTAIYQGNAVPYTVTVIDRFSNLLPETGRLVSGTPGVVVDGVSARAIAGPSRQLVRAAFGAVTDSAWLSIVPRATIAVRVRRVTQPDYNWVFASLELDGSNYSPILIRNPHGNSVGDMGPQWTRDGNALVFFDKVDGSIGARLYRSSDGGTASELFARVSESDMWPQVTAAEDWIYFAGESAGGARVDLYRARLDGSEAARMSEVTAIYGQLDLYPSPSPDGAKVAYATNRDGPEYRLRILDIVTGTSSSLGVVGNMPRWSPTGEWIAFLRGDHHQGDARLFLVRPDGSGERQLSPTGVNYEFPVSWSPDGQYLVAGRYGGLIDVFVVAAGVQLPLAFTDLLIVPAWRP